MPENGLLPVPELLWYSCDGMMVIDERRRILALNPALEQLIGRSREEVVGKSECGALFSCRDLQGCPLAEHPEECPGLKAIQSFKAVPAAEYTIRTAQGKARVVSTSYTPMELPGRPVCALAILRDVTAQKRRERRLARQAMTDALTGLPNRTAFLEAGLREFKRAARNPRPLSFAMADLDGFKGYNDAYGHPTGDELLKSVAGLLRSGRRAADLVCRYGGDEFAILLPETDAVGAVVVTERLRYSIAGFPFPPPRPITLSVGVATFPEDGASTESLIALADKRLFAAKHRGGNQVVAVDASR